MQYVLFLTDASLVDIQIVFDWYESQQQGLGEKFLTTLEKEFERIKRNPLIFPVKYKGTREIILKPFPHLLLYKIYKNQILIFCLFNSRKNPHEKLKRIKEQD